GDGVVVGGVALGNGGGASAPPGVVSTVDRLGVRVGTGEGDLLIVGAEIGGRAAGLHALGLSPRTRLGPGRPPRPAARPCPRPAPPRRTPCARGYGLLLLAFLLMTLPHGRRFFHSERWGGYAQSSPMVDAVQNPVVYPLLMASWLLAAALLVLGWGGWIPALWNLLLCRYFFVDM